MSLLAPGLSLGVDVGGTKILALACDAEGASAASAQVPSPKGDVEDGGASLADAVCTAITSVAADLGVSAGDLPIGLGLPGNGTGSVRLIGPGRRGS